VAWTSSIIVPAHSYYLWASSVNGFSTLVGANVSSTDFLAANNSIAIRQGALNTGTLIDSLSWNNTVDSFTSLFEGTIFGSSPGAGQSLERKAYSTSSAVSMFTGGADESKGNGFDSNNNATDFVLRTVSQPQHSGGGTEMP
jgi:hypothetical protein